MFSIILPAFNEADRLESSAERLISVLKSENISHEIIIAEDGSTDGSDKIAARLAREKGFIKHLHSNKRLGRGLALKRCGKIIKGDYAVYMDVDLAPEFGKRLTETMRFFKGDFDIVIGSRYHELSKTERSFGRKVASKSYNFLQKILFGVPINDLQCGFKVFKKNIFIQMNKEVEANGWFWDTEILIRSFLKGYKIKEIPVEWKEGKQTKVKIIKDSWSMGISLIKLWFKLKVGSRLTRGSKVERLISRTLYSFLYNTLTLMLFFDGVHDHQCGFKASSNDLAKALMDKIKSSGLLIDTER